MENVGFLVKEKDVIAVVELISEFMAVTGWGYTFIDDGKAKCNYCGNVAPSKREISHADDCLIPQLDEIKEAWSELLSWPG